MSMNLTTAFIQQFGDEVTHAYQAESRLRSTVRVKSGVVGSSYRWPKMGKGIAQIRTPQTDITPMGVGHSNVTATLTDWNAPEYTDIFMQQKVNFDEKQQLVKVSSRAIGRRVDQIIIDALIAATAPELVGNDIGATDSNWNIGKLIEAKALLDANNVPPSGRHILMHARGLASLLGTTQVTSSDYNTVKALVRGEVNEFMGFQFHTIGDMDEGGLPKDGSNDRTNFAWHEDAVGLAIGLDMQTHIDWVAEKTSWLVNTYFSAGAVAIDEEGIVEITTRET
jgi:hypothetical protein